MTKPMSENDRKRPSASPLRAVILVCAAAVVVFFALIPRTPPDVRRRAIASHLTSWVRDRLHQNWINGVDFLPEGRYTRGDPYVFHFVVKPNPTRFDQTPTLAGRIQYDDLNAGRVVVELDSGEVYEFDKETDRFSKLESAKMLNRATWETVHVYVFGPVH